MAITNTLVEAAEQIFTGAGCGQEKLEYVRSELQKRGITYDQAKLESAVFNLGNVIFEDTIEVGEAAQEETTESCSSTESCS